MRGYPVAKVKPPQAKTGHIQTDRATATLGMAACVVRGGQKRGKVTGAAPRMTQTLREEDRLPKLPSQCLAARA